MTYWTRFDGMFRLLLYVVIYLYWRQRMGDASLFLSVFGSTIVVGPDSISRRDIFRMWCINSGLRVFHQDMYAW